MGYCVGMQTLSNGKVDEMAFYLCNSYQATGAAIEYSTDIYSRESLLTVADKWGKACVCFLHNGDARLRLREGFQQIGLPLPGADGVAAAFSIALTII